MANLSAEGVKIVVQLGEKQGRLYLRELLGWMEFDEIRDLRRSIQLDILYRSVVFAAEKGLPWPAVAEVGMLTGEILEKTVGLPISQTVQALQQKLTSFPVNLPPLKLRALFDYFHNTYIKHYWLYQFTLARERDRSQAFASFEVYTPPQPLPLTEGIDVEVWKFQQQLATLSAEEDKKRANVLLLRETLHQEKERMLCRLYSDLTGQVDVLEKEALASLVKEAIQIQLENLRDVLQSEIEATFDILQLKLQKKTLMLDPPTPYPPPPVPEGRRQSKTPKVKQEKDKEVKEKKKKKKKV